MATHEYQASLSWSGNTLDGDYSREHDAELNGGTWQLSADPSFRGDPALPNPEQLLVAAASSCQLLSFLGAASRANVEVLSYDDAASGAMPEGQIPLRITEITLRPRVTVRGARAAHVEKLLHKAHSVCYIANSVNAAITIDPTISVE